jgi:hypothetical protein
MQRKIQGFKEQFELVFMLIVFISLTNIVKAAAEPTDQNSTCVRNTNEIANPYSGDSCIQRFPRCYS